MKKMIYAAFAAGITAALEAVSVSADNPIVQTRFTADPAPMVSSDGETLYLFTSHDEPEGGENGAMYIMNDWNLYSTKDMVNWTDLGVPTSYKVFDWAKGDAWAIQTVEKNGKYYLYAPVKAQSTTGIGVAVADRPEGPYRDAIGEPLTERFSFIDPSVYVDEESGRAFIVWGNPDPYFAELNDDMISFKTQPVKINKTVDSFGKSDKENRDTRYEEGPWLQKHGEYCYLVYAGNGIPEDLEYSFCKYDEFLAWVDALPKADGSGDYKLVDGPWAYGDVLMVTFNSGTFTNHPGLVDFKDTSYLFYHTAQLPNANGFRRSVAVDVMTYNYSDGKIPTVTPTSAGPDAIAKLDPYERTEAETIAFSKGLESDEYYTVTATGEKTDTFTNNDTKNVYIKSIENDDYIKVANVDFGAGAGMFTASVASDKKGGSIELRLDSLDGAVIGTLPVSYTAGEWQEKSAGITGAAGTHDLYFVFKGESREEDLFSFDYWRFEEKTGEKTLTAVNACLDEYKIDTKDGANTANMTVTAVYSDGTTEDITHSEGLKVTSENIKYADGIVTGTSYGEAVIAVSYGGITENVRLIVKDMDTELTADSISVTPGAVKFVYGGAAVELAVTATYKDGHTEDVTEKAVYSSANTSIAQTDGYKVIPKAMGTTAVTVSYTGELGGTVSANVPVTVSANMLKNGNFDMDSSEWLISNDGWATEHEGRKGVARVAEGTSSGVRSIEQFVTGMLTLEPGKQYKMSADIYYTKKADETDASFNVWLLTRWAAEDGNQLAGGFSNASVTPGEWTTVSLTLSITDVESLLKRGAEQASFVIESGMDYTNEFYVDNVTLSDADVSEPIEEKLTTKTAAQRIDSNIVLTVTASDIITDKVLHIALYDENDKLVRYMKVPTSASEKTAYVVFQGDVSAKKAKIYVWDSIEGMMPETDAETVEIK